MARAGIVTVTGSGRHVRDQRDWRHEAPTRPALPPSLSRHRPRPWGQVAPGRGVHPDPGVDQDGVVLDILVQPRRDAKAAKRFFRRLLKDLQYVPRVIVTDKPRSYGVAHRERLPKVEHRQSRYLNNRAGNSHRPTRR